MILSDPYQFLFIHNPKVAGSSIRKVLLPFNTASVELWHQRYIETLDRVIDMSHIAARDVPHVVNVPESYFRFGFVRDPYQRFFSSVREHARQNNKVLETRGQISDFALKELNHSSIRFNWNYSHFCPQHYYFYSGRKLNADFIGYQGRLEEDFAKVLSILGLPVENANKLGRERDSNLSKITPEKFLTEEALAHVNSLYSKDWFYFSYLFEEPMVGDATPCGTHVQNVHNIRDFEARVTYYGEPPGLSIYEKAGWLTTRVEELEKELKVRREAALK